MDTALTKLAYQNRRLWIIMTSISAYLSIYNDWDLLKPALESMKGHIDELVVVDGAYKWMVPYLEALGKDPLRSDKELYNIIENSGIPTRIVSNIWSNEVEKRISGYAACDTSYVFRIDADEIIFFNDSAFDQFLISNSAVAEMDMPFYDSPGLVHAEGARETFGRQAFLFDKRQLTAEQHLHYLWLVLTADKLPEHGGERLSVFPEPIAFNAHLSSWRTPRGSAQRSAFYQMNWMRSNGVPYSERLRGKPVLDFKDFFDFISPNDYISILHRSEISNGHYNIIGDCLKKSPLTENQEASIVPFYARLIEAKNALNDEARAQPQPFFSGVPICLDATLRDGKRNLFETGVLKILASENISSVSATLKKVNSSIPFTNSINLTSSVLLDTAEISIFDIKENIDNEIRATLTIEIRLISGKEVGKFRITN